MKKVKLNQPVPDIELHATDDQTFCLSDLKDRHAVLYFYPKDNTPGCTTQGQNFRDSFDEFKKLGADIYGVSKDSLKSHESFKAEQCFPFELISDPDGKLCALFDVIKEKSLYGKKYLGIERSTFIIDKKGVLRKEFRGVKVDGHVQQVLAALKSL
jgi:peroxiredoxin Q/BCP